MKLSKLIEELVGLQKPDFDPDVKILADGELVEIVVIDYINRVGETIYISGY